LPSGETETSMRSLAVSTLIATLGLLVSCSRPDPKEECTRYRVEMQEIERKWSASPPVGLDVIGEGLYRRNYEQKHPAYTEEKNRVRQRFERRLDTSNIDSFCQSF
jgi:hypothetical protein